MRKLMWLVCGIGLSAAAYGDTFTFSVIPGTGDISGSPGSTVGWGYSITNKSTTDWLGELGLTAGVFTNGVANAIFDYPIIAPGQTVTEFFNASVPLGLYEFTWNATAPVGSVNSGAFLLTGSFYADESDADNDSNEISTEIDSQSFSVTVSSVPELGSWILLVTVMAGVVLIKMFCSAGFSNRSAGH